MARDTFQFKAQGDDGRLYTVYGSRPVMQGRVKPRTRATPQALALTLWVAGGGTVARLAKGRYRVVATGVTLLSDHPEAP